MIPWPFNQYNISPYSVATCSLVLHMSPSLPNQAKADVSNCQANNEFSNNVYWSSQQHQLTF